MARRWWRPVGQSQPECSGGHVEVEPHPGGGELVWRPRRRLGAPPAHASRPVQVDNYYRDGGGGHDQDGGRLGGRQAGTGELHVCEDRERVGVVGDDDDGAILRRWPAARSAANRPGCPGRR